jgi:hypothetical protein
MEVAMSKFYEHKNKGSSAFSPMAQATAVMDAQRETNKWMQSQGQLCWKCQKDSIPEKGCKIEMRVGLKKYICKACVDAKGANKC